jgi:hypothetical protein
MLIGIQIVLKRVALNKGITQTKPFFESESVDMKEERIGRECGVESDFYSRGAVEYRQSRRWPPTTLKQGVLDFCSHWYVSF